MGTTSNSSSLLGTTLSHSTAYSLKTITSCTRTKGATVGRDFWNAGSALCAQCLFTSTPLSIFLQCHREEQIKASLHPILQSTLGESLTLGRGRGGNCQPRASGTAGSQLLFASARLPRPLGSTPSAAKYWSQLRRPLSPKVPARPASRV